MASIHPVTNERAAILACVLAITGCFTEPTKYELLQNSATEAGSPTEPSTSGITNGGLGGSFEVSSTAGRTTGNATAGAPTDSAGQAGFAQTTDGGRAGAEVNAAGAPATAMGGSVSASGASSVGGIDSGGAAAGGAAEGGLVEGRAGQQGTAGQGGYSATGGAPNLGGSSGTLAIGGTPPTGGTSGAGPTAGAGGSIGDCNGSAVTRVLGGLYVVQNNVWNAESVQCISVDGTSFSITRAEHDKVVPGLPASYPSIFVGCAGGTCSSGSLLPLSVRRVEMLRAYWKMSLPGTGAFNARYNLVFSKASTGGAPNSAISMEIKIWLGALGGVSPAGGTVVQGATILNEPWTIWFAQNASGDRGDLAYVRTSAIDESSHELLAFVRDAVDRGYISETDLLTSVQAGFEIWKEGTGLTTSQFALDLNARSCGPEICNNADDNCDGQTDEGLRLGEACKVGIGACAATGSLVCASNQLTPVCGAVAGSPGTESCDADYRDEDCDGLTNEGCACVPGTSPDLPCGTSGVGACRMGVQRCAGGSYALCEGAVLPSAELCDGIDNDCDGQTDEDFAMDQPCSVGVGACTANGVRVCASDHMTATCSVAATTPGTEICDPDYLDEDCDGLTNEGCDCVPGTSPDLPCGASNVGACRMGVQRCIGGAYTLCEGVVLPAAELCDRIDNDCDGQADEDFGLGQSCNVGIGACAATGTRVCATNQSAAVCSVVAKPGGAEICDAAYADEDCDGLTNEECGCVPGTSPDLPCGASNVGTCRMGAQRCVNGSYAACSGAVLPSSELCDGADNDCDGQVDEDFALGQPCQVGVGACAATGTRVCASNQLSSVCSAAAKSAATEVCDAAYVDEDCDGQTNEGCACVPGTSPDLPCGTNSVGACKMGVQRCVGGTYTTCNAAVYPASELCDGIDNDCDGQIDEEFGLGQPCQVGVGACSATGTRVCASNLSTAVCNAVPGVPTTETCNDIDDNCDGLADYTIVAGRPESACLCGSLPIRPTTGAREPAEVVVSPSVCTVSSDGAMNMTFHLRSCADPYPWAQCRFDSVNLQGFDADQVGHGGVLEVRFCTDQYIYSGLSLYYGTYPKRKRLDLLTDQESTNGLAPNCYVRYRAPSDANCPVFTSLTEPPIADLPIACRNGCQNGRWSAESSQCAFSYSGVPVWLTAEFCRANTPPPLPVTVSNLTVRHLEQTCICLDNQQCKDPSRRFCDGSAALPSSQCSSSDRCAGVCTSGQ